MTRERRKLRFDDWGDVIADAEMLRARGYDHASYGTLSLGQITSHLATVLSGAVDGYPSLYPWPMRAVIRSLFLKKMLRHEPSGVRVNSPQFLAPPDQCEDDAGIERLRGEVERFRNHEGEYHPHVVLGKLSRDQWKHQQLWHCEHHLSFLLPRKSAE